MAELYRLISIIAFFLSGLFLLLSVFLFVFFKITRVIGDLTGRTAAKQIEKFRQSNTASGIKSFRPDPVNAKRGKLTEQVSDNYAADPKTSAAAHPSKRLDHKGATGKMGKTASIGTIGRNASPQGTDVLADGTTALNEGGITASLSENTTILNEPDDNVTAVLSDDGSNVTTVLSDDAPNVTMVLSDDGANATTFLSDETSNATTVLSSDEDNAGNKSNEGVNSVLTMVKSIVVVHTNEVIE